MKTFFVESIIGSAACVLNYRFILFYINSKGSRVPEVMIIEDTFRFLRIFLKTFSAVRQPISKIIDYI